MSREPAFEPERIVAGLNEAGVEYVIVGGRHPIEDALTGASLARPASFKLRTRHGDVQVLNRMPGTPPFHRLRDERLLVEIAPNVVAPVCSLAHLRAMKRAAGRPRDLVDLAELDALHGAD